MSMIERVARAMCRSFGHDAKPDRLEAIVSTDWPLFVPAARAALEAMREPSEGMVRNLASGAWCEGADAMTADHARAGWAGAIDAALSGE